MTPTAEEATVEHFVDDVGHDCYRICLSNGICSIVNSSHLIEERKAQLIRWNSYPTPP
jgi:hypothetical protein